MSPKGQEKAWNKNLEAFNIALLCKWRWKCLTGSNNLWFKLLKSRYGDLSKWRDMETTQQNLKKSSLWWRDINLLGTKFTQDSFWFNKVSKLQLGNGDKLRFWFDGWCGPTPFSSLFLNLFQACPEKMAHMWQYGNWSENIWEWNWAWKNGLSGAADEEAMELKVCCMMRCWPVLMKTSGCGKLITKNSSQ